jgi:hypothetical protein
MWKNIVERGRAQMTVWLIRIECWIPKAIDTHSEYAILTASPLQQWLPESATVLLYTYVYIGCVVERNSHPTDFIPIKCCRWG